MNKSKFFEILYARVLPASLWAFTLLAAADRLERGLVNFGVANTFAQLNYMNEEKKAMANELKRLLPPHKEEQ